MQVIYRGRRHLVVKPAGTSLWLKPLAPPGGRPVRVACGHPNLILEPTAEDIEFATAYERGEVRAFEYEDGRTYPPGHEVGRFARERT